MAGRAKRFDEPMADAPQSMPTSGEWVVAARSSDVARAPTAARIGDVAIVLFRRADGSVAAIEDRCPHYDMPLSTGEIVGDHIECGYHGLRFDGSGRCVHMPATKEPPQRFRVRCFEVAETDGLVRVRV